MIDKLTAIFEKQSAMALALYNRVSTRQAILLGALGGFCLAALASALIVRDYSKPNREIFTEMAYSYAAESQREYDAEVLPGGMVQQPAPEGTLYRGQKVYDPEGVNKKPEDAAGLNNPYKADEAVLARGAELYRMSCSPCHGLNAGGGAPVTKYGIAAPSLLAGSPKARSDGELFHIITRGFNTMAPHAAHVKHDDRWKIILHLRDLQSGK